METDSFACLFARLFPVWARDACRRQVLASGALLTSGRPSGRARTRAGASKNASTRKGPKQTQAMHCGAAASEPATM